jgi:hypothetical protein
MQNPSEDFSMLQNDSEEFSTPQNTSHRAPGIERGKKYIGAEVPSEAQAHSNFLLMKQRTPRLQQPASVVLSG